MNKILSLRTRLILTMVILITVCSAVFATGIVLIKERLEEITFGRMVENQLQAIISHMKEGSPFSNDIFPDWRIYAGKDLEQLPPAFQGLAPGSHHSLLVEDHYYQLAVGNVDGNPVYLSYDITAWEAQEHAVLEMVAWGVVIMLLLAILLGVRSSHTILAPLGELTRELANIQPGERNIRIAGHYKGIEVGQIAAAFDRYQERLDRFVEREKFLTAAASHELRTPLSVVSGAVDVLEARKVHGDPGKRALDRIRRACGEMTGFIETVLLLSREETAFDQAGRKTDIRTLIEEMVVDYHEQLDEAGITLEQDYLGDTHIEAPEKVVQIVVGNILRNAIEHTRHGHIRILWENPGLQIVDNGCGIAEQNLSEVFDRNYTTRPGGTGLGLNLVRRLCDRFNWTVTIDSEPGKGTRVTVKF